MGIGVDVSVGGPLCTPRRFSEDGTDRIILPCISPWYPPRHVKVTPFIPLVRKVQKVLTGLKFVRSYNRKFHIDT